MFKLMRPSDSLAAKLIIAIGGLMIAGGVMVGLMFYKYERDVTVSNLTGHSRFASGMVLKSLKHDMLEADPSDIRLSLMNFATGGDIKEIVVYSARGEAAYSTDPALVGVPLIEDDPALITLKSGRPEIIIERTPDGTTVLSQYTPIYNEPSCRNSACHYHPRDEKLIGALKTKLSSAHIEGASRQMLVGALVLGTLFILMTSASLLIINFLLVTRPIATIESGMRRLAEGRFGEPIEIRTTDEVGRLARNFNTMAHDIQRYKDKLENWAKELEAEVEKKAAEIKEAQDQLVNAEKLASLGRLAAGVAHEINNPLTGIVTFSHLMLERCPEDRAEDREDLTMIIEQADRCTKIVKGLLGFSRKGSSERTLCNLNSLIENSYSMVQNQSAFYDIQLSMKFADRMPHIHVDPNQIQQVILNMFTNASDAMNGVGQITITTGTVMEDGTEYVEMGFTDTGPGILPEHMSRILEPFFTTKEVGKGTGLGLPVSYGIIKRHGGDLFVKSQVGRGTTFTMRLPVALPEGASPSPGTGRASDE